MKKVMDIKKATTLKDLHIAMVPKGPSTVTSQDNDKANCDNDETTGDNVARDKDNGGSSVNESESACTAIEGKLRTSEETSFAQIGDRDDILGESVASSDKNVTKGSKEMEMGNDVVKAFNSAIVGVMNIGVKCEPGASSFCVNGEGMDIDGKKEKNSDSEKVNKPVINVVTKPKIVYFFERGDSLKIENGDINEDENANSVSVRDRGDGADSKIKERNKKEERSKRKKEEERSKRKKEEERSKRKKEEERSKSSKEEARKKRPHGDEVSVTRDIL